MGVVVYVWDRGLIQRGAWGHAAIAVSGGQPPVGRARVGGDRRIASSTAAEPGHAIFLPEMKRALGGEPTAKEVIK